MSDSTLVRIAAHSIESGDIPFNLYASDNQFGVVLFCKSGFAISDKHKESLWESGRHFYVGSNEMLAYHDYAIKRLPETLNNSAHTTAKKIELITSLTNITITNMFKDPRSSQAMNASRDFVKSYLDLVISSSVAIENLFALSTTSSYSLSHSINVCTFNILIGEYMFGRDHEKLWKLGMGGLLLDIGMCVMNSDVIEKDSALEEHERKIMRLHTVKSEEIIRDHGLPEEMQLMGRHHHERANGSGYPDKIKTDEMSDYAAIAAVVDVYDAMTSERNHRTKKTHYQALAEMSINKHLYDERALEILMKLVLQNDDLVREFMIGGKNIRKLCEAG